MQATAQTIKPGAPAGFQRRSDGDIVDVSRQWASRSPDEAVFSIEELLLRTEHNKRSSAHKSGVSWDSLHVAADGERLGLVGQGGTPAYFSNWSLSQLCSLPSSDGAGGLAPAGFLGKLSASTAAQILNERMAAGIGRKREANLLVKRNGSLQLRAITTDAYTRVWDHDLALRVADLCEGSSWGPAEAFKRAGDSGHAFGQAGKHDALPLGWVGDRSMYVCLVDYDGVIHSDGNTYARFFLLSNSEVGAGSLKVTFGLLDFVCCNMILWGCTEVYEANFKHTRSIHERWAEISGGFNRQLSADNRSEILEGIQGARRVLIADSQPEVIAKVQAVTDLPRKLVSGAYDVAAEAQRYGDPRSVWGMVNGLTELSQTTSFADQRSAIDLKASRLLRSA